MILRPPAREELELVAELCLRSKAVWGYDREFIEACREALTISPAELAEGLTRVLEVRGAILGVVQLRLKGLEATLEKLFVEPAVLRRGHGRRLLAWAQEAALAAGACVLVIEADPGAASFYDRMGARRVGDVASESIPGRRLPRYELELRQRLA